MNVYSTIMACERGTAYKDMAKILVIDDDPMIRDFVSKCLTAQNHVVIEAGSGKEGLKLALKGWEQPHLIILDIVMEGMDGIQVLQQIKKHEKTCAIPVIMLTGYNDEKYIEASMKNYAFEFLAKPVSIKDLTEKVAQILGK